MNYLAFDTSSPTLTIILSVGGKDYTYFNEKCGTQHSLTLMTEIENVMIKSGASFTDLDFVACVTGAGSFTGIRIGVATLKAICFANGLKGLGVTSFDTLAYNKPSGKVLAVIDAKHDAFYALGYEDLMPTFAPSFLQRDEVEKLLGEYTVVGAEELPFNYISVDKEKGLKKAVESLAKNATFDLDKIEPLYIRKSQAEENR